MYIRMFGIFGLYPLFILLLFVGILYFGYINNFLPLTTPIEIETDNRDVIYSSATTGESPYSTDAPDAPDAPTKIPLKIFQTWHSKTLPPKMKDCVISLKRKNPEFKHYLFDDADCREFIRQHFDTPVLEAFDRLKPGAFKADLWRYCILYIHGGIYLDIKFCCVDNFKLMELTDDEYFVRDYGSEWAVYNAFMVCKPKNHTLLNCIKQIVQNVETQYYGSGSLEITGPKMMVRFFTPNEKRKLNRILLNPTNNGMLYISYGNRVILVNYPEYKKEREQNQLEEHYSILWAKREVYLAKTVE